MTRELIVQNIIYNYGKKYDITADMVEQLINSGLRNNINLNAVYSGIKLAISQVHNEHEYFTIDDVCEITKETPKEVMARIETMREDMLAEGIDPGDFFMRTQPSSKFMM